MHIHLHNPCINAYINGSICMRVGDKNHDILSSYKSVSFLQFLKEDFSKTMDGALSLQWLFSTHKRLFVSFNVSRNSLHVSKQAKAKTSGASQLFIKDLKEEFVKDYVFPCLRAGAVYERKYLLGTSMARPIIAKVIICTCSSKHMIWCIDDIWFIFMKLFNNYLLSTLNSIIGRNFCLTDRFCLDHCVVFIYLHISVA